MLSVRPMPRRQGPILSFVAKRQLSLGRILRQFFQLAEEAMLGAAFLDQALPNRRQLAQQGLQRRLSTRRPCFLLPPKKSAMALYLFLRGAYSQLALFVAAFCKGEGYWEKN